jgi:predicted small lipoprotein YifL
MVRPTLETSVNRSAGIPFVRLAVLGALAAALALAGCGRRGPLELPPSAAIDSPQVAGQPPSPPGMLPSGEPIPPPANAPKKRFFLDFLL